MSAVKKGKKTAQNPTTARSPPRFTADERAAMKERLHELKAKAQCWRQKRRGRLSGARG